MTSKRMLIDAFHPEETRVVVIDGSRLDDFDVEVSTRRQLKGNIYLAKVTRVEPSLQAAFVDYGGNRHGFLAFNEIHPDYYQIPVADREALLAEQEAADRAADAAIGDGGEDGGEGGGEGGGLDDDDDFERRRPRISTRHYKIQEVIKRRQIMLVQVVKEERGNKGAALTTYLSLAGRYCVLMPNTSRGGGISRKITAAADRKRLKKILVELEIPQGMAVIVRTAGAGRSKAEIKRDYEYLVRLWSSIRETTLQSMAPALVYEEGSLIKRSIRDLYGRDIEEIIIQGEQEYRIAKEFMKLFIPSHAKRVKLYDNPETPLFHHYSVESQLEAMLHLTVHLRSGGYIVINPTEALVAVDVNSGRATRERHIEETALRTNLEAADEVARQLRLRDLAGLIVIDFIDMENPRNQAQVERRLKEAMKCDKARVQLGRISPFGLLELSRQRLRPSVLETSFETCPHCGGAGMRRTTESVALAILRKCEEEGINQRASELNVTVPTTVALYLLNHKRRALTVIEERYRMLIRVLGDDSVAASEYRIERTRAALPAAEAAEIEEPAEAPAVTADDDAEVESDAGEKDEGAKRSRRRRPRRRRRPGEDRETGEATADVQADEPEATEAGGDEGTEEGDVGETTPEARADADDAERKRRRRGRRGGRRRARRPAETLADGEGSAPVAEATPDDVDADEGAADAELTGEPVAEQIAQAQAVSWNDEPVEPADVTDERDGTTGTDAPSEPSEPAETAANVWHDDEPSADREGDDRAADETADVPDVPVDTQATVAEDEPAPLVPAATTETSDPWPADGDAAVPAEEATPSSSGIEELVTGGERADAAVELIVPAAEHHGGDGAALPRDGQRDSRDGQRDTNVIEVGERRTQSDDGPPRRGWWQRFLD